MWRWPGNGTFLEGASMVLTWWIVAFFSGVHRKFQTECLRLDIVTRSCYITTYFWAEQRSFLSKLLLIEPTQKRWSFWLFDPWESSNSNLWYLMLLQIIWRCQKLQGKSVIHFSVFWEHLCKILKHWAQTLARFVWYKEEISMPISKL